ncbi:MAG: hypothetical protein IK092_02350, partial [Muribaculaceae bacterium]|nr:hypothetical protein [Muribaculaceae bacterium]
ALERWDEAVNEGDELFSLSTNPDRYNATDYVKYATALDKKGMAAQAMAAYSKAIELDPSNLKLMRNLVDQAIKAKEYDKAAAYGEKLIESPEHTNSDYNRVADIYIAQYEDSTTTADVKAMAYDKSLKYLKKVLEVDPDNIIAVYNQSYLEKISETENNGKALNSMQNLIRAINKSEDISPYKPTLRYAYRYIAQYYYNKKDYRNAIDNFRKLKQYDPTNTRIDDVIEQLEKHIK